MKKNKHTYTVSPLVIAGALFIGAALFMVAWGTYRILESRILENKALQEAEAFIHPSPFSTRLAVQPTPEVQPVYPTAQPIGVGTIRTAVPASVPDDDPPTADSASPAVSPAPKTSNKGVLGIITFKSLRGRRVPLVEGVSDAQLKRGAGHHEKTALPGYSGNCLVYGHRNTVFSGFGSLSLGDLIQVDTAEGSFTYQISRMEVVEPVDPLFFQNYDHPVLTLVTCYPFHYVGSAPQRYVVICDIVT